MITLKCSGCGKTEAVMPACSVFGATSFALCARCLREGRENYRNMVNYISAAGHWPEDINPMYQTEVRRQLKLHNIPEEVFKFDVERAIAEEQAFIKEYCTGKIDLEEVMKGGGDLF